VRVLEKFEEMAVHAALACSRQRKTSQQRDAFASMSPREEKEKDQAVRKASSTCLVAKGANDALPDAKEGQGEGVALD
jgi:hypothetical protein